MVVDSVMDTYMDLGFITKYQYLDFAKEKEILAKKQENEDMICRRFYTYIDILPMEYDTVDIFLDVLKSTLK